MRAPVGEVLRGVVDDVRGADRADEFDVAGAAHPGDLRAQRRRDLHGEGADAAGGAVDQHPVPGLHRAHVPDAAQGRHPRHRHRRRLLERQARRLGHQLVRLGAGVLGERALGRSRAPRHRAEPAHVRADRLHPPAASTPATRGFGLVSPTSPISRARAGHRA